MKELVSYAIGCMMGRYSLDAPGLIYAHSGGSKALTPAATPRSLPTQTASSHSPTPIGLKMMPPIASWSSSRWPGMRLTLKTTSPSWPENLSTKQNEPSREALRRYLCDSFFKDHLQAYKKRPIYWLFSSGKQKAFQCLVYLHRYNEGTLARMRTEYVIPLQGMMTSRVRQLDEDIAAAASTAHRKRLEKERTALVKTTAGAAGV